MISGKQTAPLQTIAHCMMAGPGNHQNAVATDVKWPLIQAVKNHDGREVERLINEGVEDVNETDAQGNTALLCAVQSNVDLDIIRALVETGKANLNAKDRYGRRTSLFYAVTKSTETASYLFKNEKCFFNDSVVSSILSFFIESLCTQRHDSHPTIHEVLPLLQAKGLTPEVLAKSIVNILLCKIPLLLATSAIDGHPPRNSEHPMFHLHAKRKLFLDNLKKVNECGYLENYQRKESIKKVLEMIEGNRSISDISVFHILDLLKELGPDPNFADSDGNTAFHYAACLPWMGVPQETVKEICGKLHSFGVPLNKTNNLDETPLLFCLSGSISHLENVKSTAMKTLVEVCKFLVTRGSSLDKTSQNGESVFHLVIKLFQQGFEIPEQKVREGVIDETMKLLHLFSPPKVGNVVRECAGNLHNSPLHLWASLVLSTPVQDYTSFKLTREHSFEKLLEVILKHLLKCGAKKNGRNRDEETPLHLCNTWSAVKLLIQVGANATDKDSSKRSPLLVAASKKTFLRNPPKEKHRFYPDVQEDAYSFFTTAVEKKLDPWTVDKCENSVLGFLIAFETYDLSKALIEVACSLKEKTIFVSLLKAICKDESLRTHWKVELVKKVLSCAKERKINVVNEPFDACCETLLSQLSGMVDDGTVEAESDGMGDNGPPPSNNGTVEAEPDRMGDNGPPPSNNGTVEAEPDGMGDNGPPPSNNETEIESTLHCHIAKMLRSHGAELSGKSYETLKTKCNIEQILKNTEVQVLVPWTSKSKTHKRLLDKVARCQEYQEIGESICCHKAPAAGSFGADVFVGINKLNSKEVAIRRIGETQCKQELKNIYAHIDCEQVIRYLHLLEPDNDADFVYIVFELMEGNLDDYFMDAAAFDPKKGTSLCEGIVKGLNYLQKHGIRHFEDHLKPTSIFYKTHPELCLKITDFDHSQPETSTYVWLSPEVLTHPGNHSKYSDMFSCGLLLHYILSKGKHPFCPADCTNKSETDIVSETKDNIRHNSNREIENALSPEAADLSERMLENDSSRRPTGEKVLNHPLFWSKTKKMDFLIAVGNQPEFEYPRAGRSVVLSPIEIDFEDQFGAIVKYAHWNDRGYVHMPAIHIKMERRRRYKTNSVVELVRLIRNAHAHVSESTRPTPIKTQLLEDFVFLEYFPNLVMEVYKLMTGTTYRWHKMREEIKYTLKK